MTELTPKQFEELRETQSRARSDNMPNPPQPPIILSLGAGVQSSTLALMAAAGEVGPMPIAAIFADTGAEPRKVYEWLDWLEKQLPFPVRRVSVGNLEKDTLRAAADGTRSPGVPFFCNGSDGRPSMLWRQCTRDYKIVPIKREARRLVPKGSLIQWIGISLDEVSRMKPSNVKYITHVWPLIDRRMTRRDCLDWMVRRGFPTPPRSACLFCPYHSNAEWLRIKTEGPKEEWDRVVAMDEAVRHSLKGSKSLHRSLHRSLQPIDQVDFAGLAAKDAERLRGKEAQTELFNSECEGMCGL